jgi:hypothetical protein
MHISNNAHNGSQSIILQSTSIVPASNYGASQLIVWQIPENMSEPIDLRKSPWIDVNVSSLTKGHCKIN